MNRAVLGSGLSGLITGYLLGCPVIGEHLGGQARGAFNLGPRILEEDEESIFLLDSLGIKDEPEVFRVGYSTSSSWDWRINDEPPEGFREAYFKKTRGGTEPTASSMSSGKNKIKGWDIQKIDLVSTLAQRVPILGRTIFDIHLIRFGWGRVTTAKRTNSGLDYDDQFECNLINTLPLPTLLRLMRETTDPLIKGLPTTFISAYTENELEPWASNYDYIYFSDSSLPFHRVTITGITDSLIYLVFELGPGQESKLNDLPQFRTKAKAPRYQRHKTITIPNCQIVSNLGLKEYNGIPLLGRYAQWDHGIKLNDVILEAKTLAEQMGRSFE